MDGYSEELLRQVQLRERMVLLSNVADRAAKGPLTDPDVQRVVTAIVEDGGFDALLDGDSRDQPLRDQLCALAVAALIAEGRDGEKSELIREYVRCDIDARFPRLADEYRDRVAALRDAWTFTRMPLPDAGVAEEVFVHRTKGQNAEDPRMLDLPVEIRFAVFEGHVMIGLRNYVKVAEPGAQWWVPGWYTRWSALRDDGELVQLDGGALSPAYVRPDLAAQIPELAQLWMQSRSIHQRWVYNIGQHGAHIGWDPMPPVRTSR